MLKVQETFQDTPSVHIIDNFTILSIQFIQSSYLCQRHSNFQIVPDYQSTMQKDFHREFDSDWPEPLSHHNVLKELPVSYWTDGVAKGL